MSEPPPSLFDSDVAATAVHALRDADPVLCGVIDRVGPFRLQPERDLFALLVRVVISQQISMAAAKTVAGRLKAATPRGRFTAKALNDLPIEEIRACGLSGVKAGYVKNLAAAARSLRLKEFPTLPDAEVAARVTAVKGLGPWTARMVLMFGLGRPDVLPVGDLGIRNAARSLYGFDAIPPLSAHAADTWAPWRTVAAWYLWRHIDTADVTEGLNDYPV
ncbi:DNA-3-methyladenine glycosylase family protein [Alienimonas chondri]|uniref:DNA-3-methyladenine glycosylase II n=1 Tax=Alienimonas chondri TaxID=2681879 RepID=A0ABX1V8T3_9PLAN|nr:DNA-3-methyladenine glycosylase 2 family protein [Alienimonas chondri]NNJ24199.1 putative bifunctional transcriptional activator/DNA repair enzyme AlkA [Alienimonas chondri]